VTFLPQAASWDGLGTIAAMADESAQPLHEQLEEIGVQLAWVRDYL
jgi:hypothetical protein